MSANLFWINASILQGILIILFCAYGSDTNPENNLNLTAFEFTHLMIFVGFGLLYGFLRRYSWTGIAQNFIIGAFSVEIHYVCLAFWEYLCSDSLTFWDYTIELDLTSLFVAEFCAGAVLVSFGAIVGKVNTFQLVIMAEFEIFFYCLNEYLLAEFLTVDTGGGFLLHMFGCYFGLAASLVYAPPHGFNHSLNTTGYAANIYALAGTMFLWIGWPCFNSAVAQEGVTYYAIVNTVVSLLGSTVGAFGVTAILNHGKLNMVSVVNATLAGGVAIGTICGDLEYASWALMVGTLSGAVSALGFERLTPWLEKNIKLQDTAGIHNLHGIPAVIGAFFSIFFFVYYEDSEQALRQVYGFLSTMGISLASGAVFGVFLRLSKDYGTKNADFFIDDNQWVDCNTAHESGLNIELMEKHNKGGDEQ